MAIRLFKYDSRAPAAKPRRSASHSGDLSLANLRQRLSLTDRLQRSLDPQVLLDTFLEALGRRVSFDSARFACAEASFELKRGSPGRHRCSYSLKVESELLGELQLSRRTRFSSAELETVEDLLGVVVYPLRNALTHQRALRASLVDPLTNVCNRGAFEIALAREVQVARRHHGPLSLIVLDLDHFKRINDAYGHHSGDEVLKVVARTLVGCARGCDAVFRFGGEEFVIVLTNTGLDGAARLAERVRRALARQEILIGGQRVDISASLGVATLGPQDTASALFD